MSSKKPGKEYKWTDDEAELLLSVANDYKVTKAAESVDWESVKNKYGNILVLMQAELPCTIEDARRINKDYTHTRGDITKQIITTKLKAVRSKFRQAVDSGRRSGHGRVVLLYFELCKSIWGVSPATEKIEGGIETADMGSFISSATPLDVCTEATPGHTSDDETLPEPESGDMDEEGTSSASSTTQQRRELLDKSLNSYRHAKLKRKIPTDIQILDCAKEELKNKKRLVENMETIEKEYSDNMTRITNNMDKLTNSISDGFSLLRNILSPQPNLPIYPHNYHSQPSNIHHQSTYSSHHNPCSPYPPHSSTVEQTDYDHSN